jgi:sRNA-binding carbon storage regulator CsrA
MKNAPDGRRIFVWRGPGDTNRLADAVAEEAVAELFEVDRSLVWLNAGRHAPAHVNVLREIITRKIKSVRLVNRGTTDAPRWEVEDFSLDLPVEVIVALSAALLERVAKGPSAPRRLTTHEREATIQRLKQGEQPAAIAQAYDVDVEMVRRLR